MVIGFTQRSMTISERTGDVGESFCISIGVDTLRVSEKEVPIVFFSRNNRSTAVVSSLHSATLESDALFGFSHFYHSQCKRMLC